MILSFKDFVIKKALSFVGGQKYLTLQFDITNACNLTCKHCYHPHHNNRGALSLENWKAILDQYSKLLKKLQLDPCIVICGGEPMTSPLLFPLLEEINSKWNGVKIFILTNGTRLNIENIHALKKFNITVQVSLDGAVDSLHDDIRGKGNFHKAVTGIKLLRENGVTTVIQAVLSKTTSLQIEEFFLLAKMLKVNAMNFTRLMPTGNGKEYVNTGADNLLSSSELKEAMTEIIQYSRKIGVPTNTDQPLYTLIDKNLGSSGKFGFQGLTIDYKGNLKISSRTDYILGNILNEGLENLFFNHPILKQLRTREQSACGGCEHYLRCGGNRSASYIATGSFLSKDPACWYELINQIKGVI